MYSMGYEQPPGPPAFESPTKDSPSDAVDYAAMVEFINYRRHQMDKDWTWWQAHLVVDDVKEFLMMASTTQPTPPSPPSDPLDTPSGLAEQGSECAHLIWIPLYPIIYSWGDKPVTPLAEICPDCHVLKSGGKIHVPAAAPMSSTSQKPDSPPSAQETDAAP